MSNQDERLGSLLILSDLALILSTYGVLFAFNYFIEPINANVWIVCTFFVGIKILIVGISDITGIGRYYIVSLLFVLIADVIIFLINQLMAFSLSLRLILLMTIVDMVMVVIAIFIWKRITKHNFRPIEPEGISWDDDVFEENENLQPALETGLEDSSDVFHFDTIEPEVIEEINENIVEDADTQETDANETFISFDELTDELPTQEEIEKQLAFEQEYAIAESSIFESETPQTSISDDEAFSNIGLFSEETAEEIPEETIETDNVLFTTDEGPLFADDKLSELVDEGYFTSNEVIEPEASEIESLAEADTVVEEMPEEVTEVEPLEVEVEEETDEFEPTLEEPEEESVLTAETEETAETPSFETSTEPEEPVVAPEVETEPEISPEPEEIETETEETVPIEEEFNIFNYTSDQIFNQEQSEAEVLEEADTVEEQASTTSAIDDLFNVPLFHGSTEAETTEAPVMTTNVEEESDKFYVDTIYDYNDITGSTIGFNRKFAPIPFNVTQSQLYDLTNDVKSEMIRFNENLSKLIDAYNESLPSSKSNERINDLITLKNQDSINDADRIIRNKIDLLNQKGFVSEGLIHNFVEIINKLNNRVYSIEIAQENLNEKLKLEQERLAEQERQQRLWEETHKAPSTTLGSVSQAKEYTSKEEPILNDSEVLLRNDEMDIIIDSADLELLKEFMAQQEKK